MVRAGLVFLLVSLSACTHATSAADPGTSTVGSPSASVDHLVRQVETAELRFDGVYRSERVEDPHGHYWMYLRFYEDGLVVCVSSSGTPNQIRRWFTRDDATLPQGRFALEDAHLSFSTTSTSGVVDFEGELRPGELKLRSESHINCHRAERTFRFVAVRPSSD